MRNAPRTIPEGYSELIGTLKERIRTAQVRAGLAVNREHVLLYWEIGNEISRRQSRGKWGDGIIKQVARDLQSEFPGTKGFLPETSSI